MAMPLLPIVSAMQQLHDQHQNALMPRQDRICIGRPKPGLTFCEYTCGLGTRLCPPAGPTVCYDHDGGDTCCSNGGTFRASASRVLHVLISFEDVCGPDYVCTNKGCCPKGFPLEDCDGAAETIATTMGGDPTQGAPSQGSSGQTSPGSTAPTTSAPPPYSPTTIFDSYTTTPTGPPGYSPFTTDSRSSSPRSPSGNSPMVTETSSSSMMLSPVDPTVGVSSNSTNASVSWYPAPQHTNAGIKGEVIGWAMSGLALMVLAFFL